LAITGLLAAAAAVNCANSIYQSNLNRKNQAKRDQQLAKTRKQHDLWVMEQQDKRQYRKLDPLVDYEIEPYTTYVAVADYLPEKAIGSHIRISIEELLRERSQIGFPLKVLGGGGCLRGDIRGEGMVKQLFFELCEKASDSLDADLLSTVNLVVCWGSVQPLMGKISPHISVFNMLDFTGELNTRFLDSLISVNEQEHLSNTIDMQLSLKMREQLWKTVNFTVDTVSLLSALQRVYELRAPFDEDVLSLLDSDSSEQIRQMIIGSLERFKESWEEHTDPDTVGKYIASLKSNIDGKMGYNEFVETTISSTTDVVTTNSSEQEEYDTDMYLNEGKLVRSKAIELMKDHFSSFTDIFVHGSIPTSKIGGAKSKYASSIRTKDALLLYDGTVFGSAKNGWLMTDEAIYTSDALTDIQLAGSGLRTTQVMYYYELSVNHGYSVKEWGTSGIALTSNDGEVLLMNIPDTAKVVLVAEFLEELFGITIERVEF